MKPGVQGMGSGKWWLCMLTLIVAVAGCAQQPGRDGDTQRAQDSASDDGTSASASSSSLPAALDEAKPVLPAQDLTEAVLYEFLLAEIAGQRGNVGLSAQAYADLARRTRDPRIARRATEIALFARMNNLALDSARVWQQTDPQSQRAAQALAGLLLGAGQFDEAYPHLRRMLSSPGSSPAEGFLQLARSLGNIKDKAGGLQLVQRLAADHAALPQARFAVAQAALGAGNEALALEEIRKAQDQRPDWEPAVLFEAQVLQRRSNTDAVNRLARYLERYPNSREIRMNYARALVTEKRIEDARTEFQKLLSDFPGNTEVIYSVAMLALQSNDLTTADVNLRRLLELGYRDRDGVRFFLGQIAEEQRRFPDALRWYGEIDPNAEQFITAQIRYASALARQGELARARTHLQTLSEKNPTQRGPLLLAEAQLLRDANENKEAFLLLGRALETQPDNPDFLYDYGMLAERLDRMDILESSMRKVIAARPDHAHAYNALGYSLADRNIRLNEARELIETALKLAPRDSFIIDSMGWVLYRMGEHAEAIRYLRQAFEDRPDAEIAAHLGEVLWVSGQRAEAQKLWEYANQKFPKNDTLINTLKRFLPN